MEHFQRILTAVRLLMMTREGLKTLAKECTEVDWKHLEQSTRLSFYDRRVVRLEA